MCGIAGIVKFSGELVRLDELHAMTDAMRHRGPDDAGFFHAGAVGIGMRRLSIIDVGGGHQPISNEDDTLWVVMNGEIYNFVELRESLKSRGHVFKTNSDTEVVLHLYEEKGVRALDDLNGMFGFALWDARQQSLWVVRDRLGIKPLYFFRSKEHLIFGSDLNALRAITRPSLSRAAILKYLAFAYVPCPDSMYQGIEKLPPAHYLWIEGGKVDCHRYWEVSNVAGWRGRPAEAAEQLEALFRDSVRLQLRSDVPLAVFLSGGIDSSAIVAAAAGAVTEPLRTLTVNFSGKAGAEDVHFARLVAERYRTEHREVVLGVAEAAGELFGLLPLLDEPISDSALIPSYILSRIAREEGIKVVLNGAGSDELFGGYRRHWPARVGSPTWVAEKLPGPIRRGIGLAWAAGQADRGLRAQDPALAWGTGIGGASLDALRQMLRDPHDYDQLTGALVTRFGGLGSARQKSGYSYGGMQLDLETYLVDDVLALGDKATMAASVEGRMPFLDHRLVELAFALPPSANLRGDRPKGLLKHILQRHLPAELLVRRKEGFSAPMHVWFQQAEVFNLDRELGEELVPVIASLLDAVEIRSLLADPARRHAASETLFSIFLLNRWCLVQGCG